LSLTVRPPTARAGLTLPTGFQDSLIYTGFGLPSAMAFLPGPPGKGPRLLVVEQKGQRVLTLVNGVLGPIPPFGHISEVDWVAGERGVLSLAVDPRWPVHPYIYTHYTSVGTIHLVRYRMTGDLTFSGSGFVSVDTSTKMYVLDDIPDVNTNHNGGCLRFGPDGMLYLSTGEDQVACQAQDTTSLAGKVLRMDVSALPATGRGPFPHALITPTDNPHVSSPDDHFRLVYALGLRNPFRMHFDPVDGALFIADVGQATFEEVNRITGPANLGWPWYENQTPYTTCGGVAPGGLVFPIATLTNPPSRSIMSVAVYRAPAGATAPFPAEYEGDYFFADYFSGVVRRIGFDGVAWSLEPATGQPGPQDWGTGALEIVDGAVAPDGSLWYLIQGIDFAFNNGAVHRVGWADPAEDTVTAVGIGAHGSVALSSPRPNPMRGSSELAWSQTTAGPVELTVHDLAGRRVATLERGARGTGSHHAVWDGRDDAGRALPAGAYVVRLAAAGQVRTQRLVRVR
jgi:glucose/arabinose dehydrogenase